MINQSDPVLFMVIGYILFTSHTEQKVSGTHIQI